MTVAVATQTGCSRCASPLEDGDLRCAVCALPIAASRATPEMERAGVEKVRVQILRCTWCGAAIGFDANHQAPACGFCSSVMTVEQPVDPIEVATLRVPFMVDRERATAALRTWLGKRGYFAPATLRDEAVLESLTPLCWAAWIVNAEAVVAWTADSDAGARRSAWAPHAGQTKQTFGNIIVPASRGLTADECSLLVPYYDLGKVVGIDAPGIPGEVPPSPEPGIRLAPLGIPDENPGPPTRPPSPEPRPMIESFDAQRSAARQHINRAIEALAAIRVQKYEVPGRRFRHVRVACLLERQTTDRVALPAWVMAYRFRGSPYRAIVHGQRGEVVFGSSPHDWRKVARVVGGIALAILAIVAAVLLLSGGDEPTPDSPLTRWPSAHDQGATRAAR